MALPPKPLFCFQSGHVFPFLTSSLQELRAERGIYIGCVARESEGVNFLVNSCLLLIQNINVLFQRDKSIFLGFASSAQNLNGPMVTLFLPGHE